eukprot:COSAG01_NODE_11851_length_1847_cov_3.469680_2_plen_69_part_00
MRQQASASSISQQASGLSRLRATRQAAASSHRSTVGNTWGTAAAAGRHRRNYTVSVTGESFAVGCEAP